MHSRIDSIAEIPSCERIEEPNRRNGEGSSEVGKAIRTFGYSESTEHGVFRDAQISRGPKSNQGLNIQFAA